MYKWTIIVQTYIIHGKTIFYSLLEMASYLQE